MYLGVAFVSVAAEAAETIVRCRRILQSCYDETDTVLCVHIFTGQIELGLHSSTSSKFFEVCKARGELGEEVFDCLLGKHSAFIEMKDKVAVRGGYDCAEVFGVSTATLESKARQVIWSMHNNSSDISSRCTFLGVGGVGWLFQN